MFFLASDTPCLFKLLLNLLMSLTLASSAWTRMRKGIGQSRKRTVAHSY